MTTTVVSVQQSQGAYFCMDENAIAIVCATRTIYAESLQRKKQILKG